MLLALKQFGGAQQMANLMTVLVAVSVVISVPVSAETLHLVCTGGGTGSKSTSSAVFGQDSNGNYKTTNIIGSRSEGFEGQIDLEIDGDAGRIRMPGVMLPPIHGGDDGWFKLQSLKVGEDQITASAGVNFLEHQTDIRRARPGEWLDHL
jgi:hypothetical protein